MPEQNTTVVVGFVAFGAGILVGVIACFAISATSETPIVAQPIGDVAKLEVIQQELSDVKRMADGLESQRRSLEKRVVEMQHAAEAKETILREMTVERDAYKTSLNKLSPTRTIPNEQNGVDGKPRGNPSYSKDITRWRRMRLGMMEAEVRELLGEPLEISVARTLTFWDYERASLGSQVEFTNGLVSGWREPTE